MELSLINVPTATAAAAEICWRNLRLTQHKPAVAVEGAFSEHACLFSV
jgi:hypothetical protein